LKGRDHKPRDADMDFTHLHFKGKTTSPWSIGRRYYSNFIYCQNYLWGRAIRGPILGYLLKSYCPHLPADILPCDQCTEQKECPYFHLNGSEKEGELKDTPKLVVTTLTFDKYESSRISLISRDSATNGVALGPVTIEHVPSDVSFEFEVILTGDATRFSDQVIEAVKGTLTLIGWGGRCSRGYGRGRILNVSENNFDEWLMQYVDKRVGVLEDESNVTLKLFPLLILDTDAKIKHCLSERYWQFFKEPHYLDIKSVSGSCSFTTLRAWSRKDNDAGRFGGLTGDLNLEFRTPLKKEDLRTLSIAWYGIGRYKNQGFGSLRPKEG
jgi:hypothetical protein